ncbi:hypothetical protein ACU4GD_09955 [Cupriavidus basilensis]
MMDALRIDKAILAGYDWGSRTACVIAASVAGAFCCKASVSATGYIINNLEFNKRPLAAERRARVVVSDSTFATERGKAGLRGSPARSRQGDLEGEFPCVEL